MDAIVIADSGAESLSATNPLRLSLCERTASIQVVLSYLGHGGEIVEPIPGESLAAWSSAPKLNGVFLGAYLAQQGFEVDLIDRYFEEKNRFRELIRGNPRAVIISTTFIAGKKTLRKLVADIRSVAPGVFIIAGGPLIYLSYLVLQKRRQGGYDTESAKEDFLFLAQGDDPLVDLHIVSLRGETILVEVLRRIKDGKSLHEIPNTIRHSGDGYELSPRWQEGLEAEPFLIPWRSVPDAVFQSSVVPMQASVGCPYRCAFCNFTKDRRLNYIKPLEVLVDEIREVVRRGARYIWFVDDNFRLGKDDLNSVCRRFIEEKFNIAWMTFVRASALKEVDTGLLKDAGCSEVQLGLESADPTVLRNMNKKATPELYSEVLRKLLGAGINCSCYFIFGFPGETDESARRTREFIKAHQFPEMEGCLYWSIFPFMLTPLSPIYEPHMREKYGLKGYMHRWRHRSMSSERAKEHVLETFLELTHSGPIYREDNQDVLRSLGHWDRKRFEWARHRLSKVALKGKISKEDVFNVFSNLAPRR